MTAVPRTRRKIRAVWLTPSSSGTCIRSGTVCVFVGMLALAGCGDELAILPPIEVPVPIIVPDGFQVDAFVTGLDLPTSIAFSPDGSNRLFVNELQSGNIRIVEGGKLLDEPFARVETNTVGGFPVSGENGLLGIAFDPRFTDNGFVYVTYATRSDSGTFGAIARFTDANNRGEDFTVLLDGIAGASGHQIESLAFGPDGMLYVSTGDAFLEDEAQDTAGLLGKILRLASDGSIPADNPFPNSYTFAYGLRNSYDLVFDDTGALVSADNGPGADDELNRVVRGGNYGWPLVLGESSDSEFVAPIYVWPEIVAPTGMAFYRHTHFPSRFNDKMLLVLFGDTFSTGPSDRAKRIQIVDTKSSPPTFEDFAIYNFPDIGNPLDVTVGPDGSVYLSDIFRGSVYRIRYDG